MVFPVVAITGSSGLIGSALVSALRGDGHRVVRMVRREPSGADESRWDPEAGDIDIGALEGVDAVVNLCGVGVHRRRWSAAFKQSLRDSRITPTEVISAAAAEAGVPVLVSASGVGYYGNREDQILDESAPAGSGFMATLAADWEAATEPAERAGVRVVLARTGLVLAPAGGLLSPLKPLFRLGAGGRIGSGRQYLSWISLEDEVRALRFIAGGNDAVRGPVNLTGPAPVTNAEFTAALGRAVNRPAPLAVPRLAVRAVLGELADEGPLNSQRAVPAALETAGFQFRHQSIGQALAYAVGDGVAD